MSIRRGTSRYLATLLLCALPVIAEASLIAQQDTGPGGFQGGGGMRGMGGMAGGRGVMGTVTAVAADHYVIKTDAGESYAVFFSVNTRILKQPASRRPAADGAAPPAGSAPAPSSGAQVRVRPEGDRPMPQEIKAAEIRVGDAVMAAGEEDAAKKTIGAIMIFQLDPERARQAREFQAQFGKTWLAGRITGIEDTKITVEGITDHAPHSFVVDENTSFRKRRDSITMADIKVGDQLRVEGAVKDGQFLATVVQAIEPRSDAANRPHQP